MIDSSPSKETASKNRPRLRVVLPLLIVCVGLVFLFVRDRFPDLSGTQSSKEPVDQPIALGVNNTRASVEGPRVSATTATVVHAVAVDQQMTAVQNVAFNSPAMPQLSGNLHPQGIRPQFDNLHIAIGVDPQSIDSEISGRISFKGTPPPEKNIPLNSVPDCWKYQNNGATTRFYLVAEDGGLADVIVHIKSGLRPAPYSPPRERTVRLTLEGCEFTPYVTGIRSSQVIEIHNANPIDHFIRRTLRPKNRPDSEVEFARPLLVNTGDLRLPTVPSEDLFQRIRCDIHPWEFAYVAVFDHPYFAVSALDGRYALQNIPPGDYTLEAVHRKAGSAVAEVTVAGGETTILDFEFTLPAEVADAK